MRIADITGYMDEIRRFERTTREEEADLGRVIRDGGEEERTEALNRLVTANLRLVVKIAHTFKRYGVAFDDLVAEGNIGLLTAAGKFDPENGAKFSVYAAWWIKQAMRSAILTKVGIIRTPGAMLQRAAHIAKVRQRYAIEHGVVPDDDYVAAALGLTVDQVMDSDAVAIEVYSMDETVSEDSDTTFDEMLSDETDTSDEERIVRIDAVRDALGRLTQMERLIICMLYGIDQPQQPILSIVKETGIPQPKLQERIQSIMDRMRSLLSGECPALA